VLPLTLGPAELAPLDDWLTPPERLAIAYAPKPMRAAWAGFLALDRRLAEAAKLGREPIMVQVRLAWWRDRFNEPASAWPTGEPLLAVLATWDQERSALAALVDGYEARNIGEDGGAELTRARIEAIGALARLSGAGDDTVIPGAAAQWLGLEGAPHTIAKLPRAMRPLAILRGMALRESSGRNGPPWREFLAILRLGMLGR
jgi:15-cis-phytoene synthase